MVPNTFNKFGLPKYLALQSLVAILACLSIYNLDFRIFNKKQFGHFKNFLPLIVYAIVVGISSIYSIDARSTIYGSFGRFEGLVTVFLYLLTAFYAGIYLSNKDGLRSVLNYGMVPMFLVSLYAIFQQFGIDFIKWNAKGHPFSTLGNANTLGTFLVVSINLGIASVLIEKQKRAMIVKMVVILVALVALIFSLTRGAWVALAISFIFFGYFLLRHNLASNILFDNKKSFGLLTATVLLLSLSAIIGLSFKYSFKSYWSVERLGKRAVSIINPTDKSSKYRLALWQGTLDLIEKEPYGTGLETFKYAIRNSDFNVAASLGKRPDRAHNDYLNIATNTGLAGLAASLWITIYAILRSISLIKRKESLDYSNEAKTEKIALVGVASALIAYLAAMIFSFSHITVTPLFWIYAGIMLNSGTSGPFQDGAENGRSKAVMTIIAIVVLLSVSFVIVKPLAADINVHYALKLAAKGDHERSIERFETALSFSSGEPHYYVRYVQVLLDAYMTTGNPDNLNKAEQALFKAKKLDPLNDRLEKQSRLLRRLLVD